jgi:hypothetical protein
MKVFKITHLLNILEEVLNILDSIITDYLQELYLKSSNNQFSSGCPIPVTSLIFQFCS